jgi:hypothetical protein
MAPRKPAYTGRAYQPSLFGRGRGPKLKPEEALQITIVEWLTLVAPHLEVVAFANEGKRTPVEQIILKRKAMRKGASDLLVVADGPINFFFEVKMPGKYPDVYQRAFMESMEKKGCIVAVTRSIDDVRRVLLKNGMHTREHLFAKQLPLI